MPYPSLAIVLAGAACVAVATGTFIGAADALALDARIALTPTPRDHPGGGIEWVHVCGAYSDLIRGKQIAVLTLLLGGVPAAMISAALTVTRRTAERRWPAAWANVFLGGFVFQLCSMTFTAFLFLVLIEIAALGLIASATLPALGAFLAAMICHVLGLRAWRTLQMSIDDAPLRILPLHHHGRST